MTRAAAALLVILATAATASADPRVDLDRCTTFDALSLARAIDREIPTIANPTNHGFAIIVECPTRNGVTLRVEPTPASGAIQRELDLGEVPGELQLKLLAVAVGELYAVAAASTPPSSPPASTAATSTAMTSNTADAPHTAPPPESHRRVATFDFDGISIGSPRTDTGAPPSPPSLTPHAGARLFTRTPRPLIDLGGEYAAHRLRFGIRGAIGQTSDALGTVRPWLAAATVGLELACTAARSACAVARVAGGVAGANADVSAANVVAHDAVVPYGDATLAGELAHSFAGVTAVASIEAGWAEGLIARSEHQDRAALAGVVAIGSLGARW